jgi:hypothetical protein
LKENILKDIHAFGAGTLVFSVSGLAKSFDFIERQIQPGKITPHVTRQLSPTEVFHGAGKI